MRFLIYQRVDIETVVDRRDTSLHLTGCHGGPSTLRANNRRFGVQPPMWLEAVCRFDAARRVDPVTAGDVNLTVQHDASRLAASHDGTTKRGVAHFCHDGSLATWEKSALRHPF